MSEVEAELGDDAYLIALSIRESELQTRTQQREERACQIIPLHKAKLHNKKLSFCI